MKEAEDRVIEVELSKPEPCKLCGVRGTHYCTGGQRGSTTYIGVHKDTSVSRKPSVEASKPTKGKDSG